MDFAYFVENTTEKFIDNSALFRIINDLEIEDEFVYSDIAGCRDELEKLLYDIDTIFIEANTKRLVIRSVVDLSDTAKGLIGVLSDLQDKGIILCSISEPYLSGENYFTMLNGFIKITNFYTEKRRKQGYENAKENGTVGRKPKTEATAKAIRLYKTGAFSTEEIEQLSGVSSSTLYRALKVVDKK
jgi:DNA invertase Pin-like site-specific DNA recombinase